jgi:imidazolonepropionase-like amidohydrolase
MIDGARIYYGLANSVTTSQHRKWEMERASKLGYDLVKTYVRLPDADQKQITIQAHEMGIPVASHELYPAVSYGVDAIEHLGATSRRGFSLKQSALRIAYGDVRTLLAESGMFMTPTLGGLGGMILHISLQPDLLTTPGYLKLVPKAHRQSFEAAYLQSTVTQTRRLMVERQQKFIRELLDAGAKITAGTDVPFLPYGWSLHVELQLYVDGGLTPFEALRTATSWAAESVGVS